MPLAPYSGYLTLAFLIGVVVLMLFDKVQGHWIRRGRVRYPGADRRLVSGARPVARPPPKQHAA